MKIIDSYPNTVFRFRSFNPNNLKELLYGEIFFAAKEELNDPYDTKNSSLFSAKVDAYERLIRKIFYGIIPSKECEELNLKPLADFLNSEPLLYDEFINKISTTDFELLVTNCLLRIKSPEVIGISISFIKSFKHYIHAWVGAPCYIASFSKICDDPTMWSHYAEHHRGFCLCFSPDSNALRSYGKFKGKGFSDKMEFKEVLYKESNVTTNAFYRFPGVIYGEPVSDEEIKDWWKIKLQSFLIKHKSWEYEQEIRLINYNSLGGNANANGVVLSRYIDRTFYYDLTQLTGLIFGAKMSENQRQEIISMVIAARERIRADVDLLPVFIFHEAKQANNKFKMDIEAIEGLDIHNRVFEISQLESKQEEFTRMHEHYTRNKYNSK